MCLVVVEPGLFTTIQDRGRPGYLAWGVPVGGAFDAEAYFLANALVGNDAGANPATLEMTLVGGTYLAEGPMAVGLAGAPMPVRIERAARSPETRSLPTSLCLHRGDRLILGGARRGARTYLAVAGGWQTPETLGSRSREQPIQAGDRLAAVASWITPRRPFARPAIEEEPDTVTLRVVDGPDAAGSAIMLEHATYRVESSSSRMGLRLDGPPLPVASEPDRLSAPVGPGAVQVAGHRPLILGVACGTMGGYPHVAHVITADLPQVAQARPGRLVRFRRVEVAEARRIDRDARRAEGPRLQRIRTMAHDGLRLAAAN